MELKLASKVKIVIETLLDGRAANMIIANGLYKVGMTEKYDVIFEAKQLCKTIEKPVWLVTDISVKSFIEIVDKMENAEICLLAAENALHKTRS